MTQRRVIGIALACILTLSACTSLTGDAISEGSGVIVVEKNENEIAPNGTAPPPIEIARPPQVASPLEEILGFIESPAEARSNLDLHHIAQQNLITACMAEQGFTYLPIKVFMSPDVAAQASVPLNTRDYAERYGFGIAGGHGRMTEESRPLDPNDELLAEMSTAGRVAWNIALYGDPQTADDWGNWEMRGCWGNAMLATGSVMQADDEWSSFGSELERFLMSIYDDPRILALDAQWASCMIDAGQPEFSRPGFFGVNLTLRDQFSSDGLWNAEPTDPRVIAFGDREIAAAVADWDCREALDYETEFRAIEVDLHQQFVDRHRAELEGWALMQAEREILIQEIAGITHP
ncbi:MAG: hypothetical protein FWG25_08815 [Promicromonosporaceae bacterium]|nr:hypothetical protein [Promicromonosporaceae bacterium]